MNLNLADKKDLMYYSSKRKFLFLLTSTVGFNVYGQGILPQWMRRSEPKSPPLIANINITDPNEAGLIEIIATTSKNRITSTKINGQEIGGFEGTIGRFEKVIPKGKNIIALVLTDEYNQTFTKEFRVDFIDKIIENKTSEQKVAEKKYKKPNLIALVIGNSNYKFAPLKNPINDARAVSDKLLSLGYKTILGLDLSRDKVIGLINEFGVLSRNHDVALVYYAGHGIQIAKENFIVPVDFDANNLKADIQKHVVNIRELISEKISSPTKLLILDACRDNPFIENVVKGRGLKFEKGLASMELDGKDDKKNIQSNGTLIAFSTKDGFVAEDGAGIHSPYTEAFLRHVTDLADINIIFRRVRQEVMKKTQGVQIPWEYGSLVGDEIVIGQMD